MADQGDPDLRQGAKAAAAAAAVGATVGLARALAVRADEAARREREDVEPADEQLEPDDVREEEPERPEKEPDIVDGTDAGRLRGLAAQARRLLEELSGAEVESVSGLDRTHDGWRVTLEAVELRRTPDSTDVLATYDVELDGDGDLVRYERRGRYVRSQADRGRGG